MLRYYRCGTPYRAISFQGGTVVAVTIAVRKVLFRQFLLTKLSGLSVSEKRFQRFRFQVPVRLLSQTVNNCVDSQNKIREELILTILALQT